MKTVRSIGIAVLLLLLFAAVSLLWFKTGSFEYRGSQIHDFAIDAPLSQVCKRAMNLKELPQAETNENAPKLDFAKAAKQFLAGEPIDYEHLHPELGLLKLKLNISLEMTDGIQIKGESVSIEPKEIRKMGMKIAELEKIEFSLAIIPKDVEPQIGLFSIIPKTGTTVIRVKSSTQLKVRCREMKFVRTIVDGQVAKNQERMIEEIRTFIDANLMKDPEGMEELESEISPETASDGALPGGRFLERAAGFLRKKDSKPEPLAAEEPKDSDLAEKAAEPKTVEGGSEEADGEERGENGSEEDIDLDILDEF